MPNLIVVLFNLMYPIFYVGFIVKVVCERESVCEDSKQLKTKAIFAGILRVGFPQSELESILFY